MFTGIIYKGRPNFQNTFHLKLIKYIKIILIKLNFIFRSFQNKFPEMGIFLLKFIHSKINFLKERYDIK